VTITVEGKIVNGQVKCKEPIALAEGTAVQVKITPAEQLDDPYADIIGICHSRPKPEATESDPLDAVIGICKGGPPDGAKNHDYYIYGKELSKRRKKPTNHKSRARRRRGARP